MHSICQIVMCVAVMVGSCGCIPFYSATDVASAPVQFVDATSKQTLSEVLVIPRYTSYSGIGVMGAGHGPGAGTHKTYVAHSFLYRAGDKFTPREPKTVELLGPGVIWIISSETLDGVVIVAPGYAPVFADNLSSDQRRCELSPLSPSRSLPDLARLRDLLSRTQLDSSKDYGPWSLDAKDKVEVRLTQSERQQAITFFDAALARLEALNPPQR